ncbi:hypothetical protein FQA39_LY01901 [Lamprigera yunnana]|nr:hypothetical protein FQA39_LY01901 [Lamprigera yunnana]
MSPNTKVADLLQNNSKEKVEEVKKKLLFSEVIQSQLKENVNLTTNVNEKELFKKELSGKIVKKYKVLDQSNMKPIRQSFIVNKSLLNLNIERRSDPLTIPENTFKGLFRISRELTHWVFYQILPNMTEPERTTAIPKNLRVSVI